MPVAAIYGTKHYAIQSDHLNTPRRLIQSDGQVAWQWAYSAFGEEKPTTAKTRFANTDLNQSFGTAAVPAVTFNLRYPGQYYDQESNLHYNYHRSYSATVGRYTQSDPIGLDGGWNRFNYAELNPLEFTDPEGLSTAGSTTGGRIGGAVGAALGGRVGAGAAGRALGTVVGAAIGEFCTPDDPPCQKCEPYGVGTIGYQGPEVGIKGIDAGKPHYWLYKVTQLPYPSCQCRWNATKDFGHHVYFLDPAWINLNSSSRPPAYPH